MDNICQKDLKERAIKKFVNFLTMSKGSAGEVRSQLIRAFDRNYIDEEVLVFEIRNYFFVKKLSGFINYLKIRNTKEINLIEKMIK